MAAFSRRLTHFGCVLGANDPSHTILPWSTLCGESNLLLHSLDGVKIHLYTMCSTRKKQRNCDRSKQGRGRNPTRVYGQVYSQTTKHFKMKHV